MIKNQDGTVTLTAFEYDFIVVGIACNDRSYSEEEMFDWCHEQEERINEVFSSPTTE